MRAAAFSALVLIASCATPAHADGPLSPLDFLHGCWLGAFAEPEGLKDERCFTPVYGGRYVRDVHTVVGTGYGGETMWAWDPEAGRIEATYFAGDGGVMRGHADARSGGLNLPDARYVSAGGEIQRLRSVWSSETRDRFSVRTERFEDGEWRPFMQIVYDRTPVQPPETPR